jgi:hypothetical protein
MRKSSWTPSIVPRGDDHDVYLIVGDLGRIGRIWREADYEATDFETVVTDLLAGQYKNPVGIFGFNTAEGWSRDVSADIAAELRRRCDLQPRDVTVGVAEFRRSTRPGRPCAACAAASYGETVKCILCADTGWVCENHPRRPWEGPHGCDSGGAGMPGRARPAI